MKKKIIAALLATLALPLVAQTGRYSVSPLFAA